MQGVHGLHTEAGLMMRQLADQGLKATFMSGDGIVSNELASIAGDAVDGTLMTFAPDPRKNPAAKDIVEKFRAAGFEPEAYTLYSYAAVQVFAAAAAAAGENDPMKVAEAAKAKGPFSTAIGDLGFDAKGDITRPDYVMYIWKKGDDGKTSLVATRTFVQTGNRIEGRAEIVKGLKAGDRVVALGQLKLQSGAAVAISKDPAPPIPAQPPRY